MTLLCPFDESEFVLCSYGIPQSRYLDSRALLYLFNSALRRRIMLPHFAILLVPFDTGMFGHSLFWFYQKLSLRTSAIRCPLSLARASYIYIDIHTSKFIQILLHYHYVKCYLRTIGVEFNRLLRLGRKNIFSVVLCLWHHHSLLLQIRNILPIQAISSICT